MTKRPRRRSAGGAFMNNDSMPGGQLQKEHSSAARRILHPQLSAVEQGDLPCDGQTQAEVLLAGAALFSPCKTAEDALTVLFRHAGAVVPHRETHSSPPALSRKLNGCARRRVFHGVVQQDGEKLLQPSLVPPDGREGLVRQLQRQIPAALAQGRAPGLPHLQ